VWVSPRKRAQQTFRLLFRDGESEIADAKVMYTEDIAEWDYGDYEGLVVDEIIRRRKAKGLEQDRKYNIWRDGCEGGEYAFTLCLNFVGQVQETLLIW
jgi:probable phosphoglycerate mutase